MKRLFCMVLSAIVFVSLAISPSATIFAEEPSNAQLLTSIQSFLPEAEGTVLAEYDDYMNTVGIENDDGTKSVYIFGTDVKYEDENGDIEYYTNEEINALSTSAASTASSSITINSNYITDAPVFSNESTFAHPNDDLCIGYDADLGIARSYVRFDLSPITSTVTCQNILSAYYHTRNITPNPSGGSTPPTDNTTAEVYLVSGSWSESGLTWTNRAGYQSNEKIGNVNIWDMYSATETYGTADAYWHDFYITTAVSAWLQGVPNYGIMIKAQDETAATSTWKALAPAEDPTYPPYLVVTYYDDSAVDSGKAVGITSSTKYHIINKKSGLYMAGHSLIAGDYVQQVTGSGAALQCWTPVYLGSGYYSLRINGTSVCLEVPDSSTTSGTELEVANYSGATRQKWRIIRNWDGSYRIISALSGYCVASASTSATSGTKVVQKTHTNNYIKEDDWTIVPAQKGSASLFCFTEEATGFLISTAHMPSISNILNARGFSSTIYTDSSAEIGFQKLQDSSVFIYNGHGNRSSLTFYDTSGSDSWITAWNPNWDVPVYSTSGLSYNTFNNLIFSCLSSCSTGADYSSTSLVGQLYQKGAHNVLSYIDITQGSSALSTGPDAYWLAKFFLGISASKTIGDAKIYADNCLLDEYANRHGNLNERHDLGDQSIRLDYAAYATASSGTTSVSVLPASSTEVERTFEAASSDPLEQAAVVDGSLQSLTYLSSKPEDTFGNAYDVYLDANKNMYSFYAGTNTLADYVPNVNSLELGETDVPVTEALSLAQTFLNDFEYDVDDFTCTHSNEYSRDFRIEYRYQIDGTPTSEKLIFHMEADESGTPYITSFMARDHGVFSGDDQEAAVAALTQELAAEEAAAQEQTLSENETVQTAYWAVDENGTICWRSLVSVYNDGVSSLRVVDRYL